MKQLCWRGDTLDRISELPLSVRRHMGYALRFAQKGTKHPSAKPLKGFGGAHMIEIVDDFMGDTYRVVYTTKHHDPIYVLHVFKKKSKHSISTPRKDLELIRRRFIDLQQELK